jgi:hypothetical protein
MFIHKKIFLSSLLSLTLCTSISAGFEEARTIERDLNIQLYLTSFITKCDLDGFTKACRECDKRISSHESKCKILDELELYAQCMRAEKFNDAVKNSDKFIQNKWIFTKSIVFGIGTIGSLYGAIYIPKMHNDLRAAPLVFLPIATACSVYTYINGRNTFTYVDKLKKEITVLDTIISTIQIIRYNLQAEL